MHNIRDNRSTAYRQNKFQRRQVEETYVHRNATDSFAKSRRDPCITLAGNTAATNGCFIATRNPNLRSDCPYVYSNFILGSGPDRNVTCQPQAEGYNAYCYPNASAGAISNINANMERCVSRAGAEDGPSTDLNAVVIGTLWWFVATTVTFLTANCIKAQIARRARQNPRPQDPALRPAAPAPEPPSWINLQSFTPTADDSHALLGNLLSNDCPLALGREGSGCVVRSPEAVHFMIYEQVLMIPRDENGRLVRHPLSPDRSFNIHTDVYKLDEAAIASITTQIPTATHCTPHASIENPGVRETQV